MLRPTGWIVLALALHAALAAAGEPSSDEMMDALMSKSGVDRQLARLPRVFERGLAEIERGGRFEPGEKERLEQAILVAFEPVALRGLVLSHLRSRLSDTDMRAALDWLESPLGLRITKLEAESQVSAILVPMMMQIAKPDDTRVAQLKRLELALHATDRELEFLTQITEVLGCAEPSIPPASSRRASNSAPQAPVDLSPLRPTLYGDILSRMVDTYLKLDESELEKYIAFNESDAGKDFRAACGESLHDAMSECTRRVRQYFERSSTSPGR